MTDLDYANKHNIFKDGEQNSQEWTEMFIRFRDKYGAPQCDPKTGLGVTYGDNLAPIAQETEQFSSKESVVGANPTGGA